MRLAFARVTALMASTEHGGQPWASHLPSFPHRSAPIPVGVQGAVTFGGPLLATADVQQLCDGPAWNAALRAEPLRERERRRGTP
jgi:hypothetical protein